MSGFRSIGSLGEAARSGQIHTAHFRKVPSQASAAGQWVDLSMAGGNPVPNYYASTPLEAATLDGLRGIFHGSDKTPATKHVLDMALCSPGSGFVGTYRLLDYLLYYPFVDLDDTTSQVMIQSASLPRYEDGDGVMAMMVTLAPTLGGGSFTFGYVNQDGVPNTSPVVTCNTTADSIATICTSQQATAARGFLFLPLASGDTGVREITDVTMLAPNGGLAAIVLVRPLCSAVIREVSVPSERSYVNELPSAPRVFDGAYLGLVANVAATVASTALAGRITFAWE